MASVIRLQVKSPTWESGITYRCQFKNQAIPLLIQLPVEVLEKAVENTSQVEDLKDAPSF